MYVDNSAPVGKLARLKAGGVSNVKENKQTRQPNNIDTENLSNRLVT